MVGSRRVKPGKPFVSFDSEIGSEERIYIYINPYLPDDSYELLSLLNRPINHWLR